MKTENRAAPVSGGFGGGYLRPPNRTLYAERWHDVECCTVGIGFCSSR